MEIMTYKIKANLFNSFEEIKKKLENISRG